MSSSRNGNRRDQSASVFGKILLSLVSKNGNNAPRRWNVNSGNGTGWLAVVCTKFPYEASGTLRETDTTAAPIQLQAILHYATSKVVPQQSLSEIRVSFNVLQRVAPCNFLVFGLDHDSLMWTPFNPGGTTLFLEKDPKWVQSVLKTAAMLNARTVSYQTHLSETDELLKSYKQEAACLPPRIRLQGNGTCRLALNNLPEKVYEREWDLIMIGTPSSCC